MSLLFQHGNGKNAYDPYIGHTNGKESGPVFLFQIFIIAPSPSQGIYNCIINNKLINNKFRFSIQNKSHLQKHF